MGKTKNTLLVLLLLRCYGGNAMDVMVMSKTMMVSPLVPAITVFGTALGG